MKRKTKQYSVIVCAVFAFAVVATVLFSTRHHISSPDSPEVVAGTQPTKQIDAHQITGGQVDDHKSSANSSAAVAPNVVLATTVPRIVPSPIDASVAPKQAEIRASVTQEYEYKALLAANDPYAQSSWALTNMNAQSAWSQSTGTGVVIAVIDTGFGLAHQDLVNQWQTNNGETGNTQSGDRCWTGVVRSKSSNSCDDDNNGYVDDYRGWNFVHGTNNPQAGLDNPAGGGVSHGTETAGLAGATGNNGIGIATLNWSARLMPLQALDDNGSGFTSDVTAAVYYAVDNGAKVISMSLGGSTDDSALVTAINYAYAHNVVVVAAAGNCGTGQESGCDPARPGAMGYPALNAHVISVGATASDNTRASFSSYGPSLSVVAPGSGTIVSPMWQSGNQTSAYAGSLFGTSFSTPLTASLVSLILSVKPSATVDDVVAIVDGTAQKVSPMAGAVYTNQYGHGLINADAAVRVAKSLNTTASATPQLRQSGSSIAEHGYTSSSAMSSGCVVAPSTYCTLRLHQTSLGYDRFLPYKLADLSGQVGWTWSAAILGSGNWETRAMQSSNISDTPYALFAK